ncbi:hypothetical protein HBI56_202630 [Parastagonospora nodorum]|nr:hypothetical protein HBH53_108700 [Parastagonospora nodorum]KAH3961952.1 hypothetical protein HBH51_178350 [Parastagonospora nodorum]KAH3970938.1 hypothetical protein HBH52_162840 [Parastagonospora nodorum]KAH3997683.1 hypothetical protein HBI10_137570 [Parastagonospora nodorum]KAH4020440.1 hypothetical protein HBI13_114880 [Parastagonospora nodorum]
MGILVEPEKKSKARYVNTRKKRPRSRRGIFKIGNAERKEIVPGDGRTDLSLAQQCTVLAKRANSTKSL